MKTGLVLGGGAAILIAGMTAFALNRESRDAEATEASAAVETPVVEEEVVLADPGTIEQEPVVEEEALPEGYVVDEDGFVWEPLSFDKPQTKLNPDGSITMKKLARIIDPDGTVREVAITGHATVDHRRLPVVQRKPRGEKAGPPASSADEKEQDGR